MEIRCTDVPPQNAENLRQQPKIQAKESKPDIHGDQHGDLWGRHNDHHLDYSC